MRLVILSDTHGYHRRIDVPAGDVLIHAGDLTSRGLIGELQDVNDWLGTLPHPHKVIVAGNHDHCCEDATDTAAEVLSNAAYLCDSGVTIAGQHFYGSPWTESASGMAFHRSAPARRKVWALIPENVAVLITHSPPLGACDQTLRGEHIGCPYLAEAVLRVRPRLHVFGHVHEGYGVAEAQGVTFVNASICNLRYFPIQQPLVIDLPV